jgi:hypothetical protein
MPIVKVVLTATVEVPDSWQIVKHADGHTVFRDTEGRYIDIDLVCMTTDSAVGATWIQDDVATEEFLESMREFESVLEEV